MGGEAEEDVDDEGQDDQDGAEGDVAEDGGVGGVVDVAEAHVGVQTESGVTTLID